MAQLKREFNTFFQTKANRTKHKQDNWDKHESRINLGKVGHRIGTDLPIPRGQHM